MQELSLWKQDRILSKINFDKIKVFSCDVFDTLVYRTTNKPEDIFEQVAEVALNLGYLKKNISSHEFKILRIEAESRARSKKNKNEGTREISLEEIYLEFPPKIGYPDKIASIELEVEKENIILNNNVYSLLKYCRMQQIKVALLSDMYLSSSYIRDILIHAGADISIFDKIIVSSENGVSKSTKGLYDVLLAQYPDTEPNEIIHLGDHYRSDFIHAREHGINAYHYALDRSVSLKYELESVKEDLCIGEILALRKQFSFYNKYLNEENNFWYEFGATVLGPIFSIFLDYVISVARDNGIKNIYPVMRDGYIFEKMLNEYNRKTEEFNIKRIYVSRKSTYLASLAEFNEKTIENYLDLPQFTVDSFMHRFNIMDHPFTKYGSYTFSSTRNVYSKGMKGLTVFDEIKNFLLRSDIKDTINDTIDRKRKLLVSYFEQEINTSEPFITIDVGYNGTIVESIEQAFRLEGKKIEAVHLFLISHKQFLNKVLDGIDLRDYIKHHEHKHFLNSIHFTSLLIEAFMFGNFGSVLDYKITENGKIVPHLEHNFIEKNNAREREICQKGIIDFYNSYLDLIKMKPQLRNRIELSVKKVAWMIERFMKYPTTKEAKYLGELYAENEFLYKDLDRLCSHKEEIKAQAWGVQKYLNGYKEKSNIWVSGVVERVFPYYMSLQLFKESQDNAIRTMANLVEYLLNNNIKECIVYGAGEMGQSLVKMLLACDIKVVKIVDRNKNLWGETIEGIEIISFAESKELNTNIYVIASQAYVQEIKDYILRNYNSSESVTIIDYTCSF